jgi:uncharacterized protein (TIGR03435 family)
MKKLTMCIFALAALVGGTLLAQNQARDLTGTWQGTLHAAKDLRTVLKISRADGGALKAVFYSIDQGAQGIPVSSISFQGSTLKFAITAIGGNYEGKLANTDGTLITGNWTQGPNPLPLDLTLANDKTAWTIPEPPPPPKQMAADANPEFEVATIKPSKEGTPFSIHPTASGNLIATNASLGYLIKFAYEVHPRQIVKGPAWLETDKFDLTAKPDKEGMPNLKQMRVMVRKLLADRFQLTFHTEKKELPVYAITVAKSGAKLTKNEGNPNGNPGYGGGPAGMRVMNSTIAEFAGFVLNEALEQPAVDQTGLGAARYDFVLKWTPDAAQTQPGGPLAGAAPATTGVDAPPDIFAAMQQQLGLKLESTKAPVDVMVIDHVEKPSDN